jgi:hypothetical protein
LCRSATEEEEEEEEEEEIYIYGKHRSKNAQHAKLSN